MNLKIGESYFIFLNSVFAFLASLLFLTTTEPNHAFEAFYYIISLLAQMGLMTYLFSLPFRLVPLRFRSYILPFVMSLFILIIIIDTQIYSFFRFHFNLMVWNVLTTAGGWSTLGITNLEISVYIAIAILFIVFQYWLLRLLSRLKLKAFWSKTHLFSLLGMQLIGSGIYAYGDLYDIYSITKVYQIVPYYQPLTVKRAFQKHFGYVPSPQVNMNINDHGNLKYPLKQIEWQEPEKKYNFIFLVVDCFRLHSFNSEITPNLWKFSQKSQTFLNHYSGGNATRNGVFSILYGVYSTYWDHFLRQNRSPIFIDRLQDLGYKTQVYASTLQSFPEFRKTAFIKMNEFVKDDFEGQMYERDIQVFSALKEYIQNNKDQSFFTYSLLDGAHSTYSFPKNEAIYQPIIDSVTYSALSDEEKRVHMKNRYHNSLRYLDKNLGAFLEDLENSGTLKNTIILITGDHGDEFMEYGHIGHSNAFTPQQVMSPLLLYIPEKAGKTYTHTTHHNDIMATLIPLLGAKNSISDFSHGENLFSEASRDTFVCSWDNCALIDPNGYMIFGTKSYNSHKVEFRDTNYEVIPKAQGLTPERNVTSANILRRMSELLQ